jgi:hypothetical protein
MKIELKFVCAHSKNFGALPVGGRRKAANMPNAQEITPAELRMQDKN